MNPYTLIAPLLLAVPVAQQTAQQPEQPVAQPAGQQLTGHVLSAETHRSHHSTSVYNPSTGQTSSGGGTSIQRDIEIQIGNLVYESSQIHKEVQVGKDWKQTDGREKKRTKTLKSGPRGPMSNTSTSPSHIAASSNVGLLA
jgi:hypothetical protein